MATSETPSFARFNVEAVLDSGATTLWPDPETDLPMVFATIEAAQQVADDAIRYGNALRAEIVRDEVASAREEVDYYRGQAEVLQTAVSGLQQEIEATKTVAREAEAKVQQARDGLASLAHGLGLSLLSTEVQTELDSLAEMIDLASREASEAEDYAGRAYSFAEDALGYISEVEAPLERAKDQAGDAQMQAEEAKGSIGQAESRLQALQRLLDGEAPASW